MMNTLARSVLTLYSYDDNANGHQHRECAAAVPAAHCRCSRLLSVYGYQAYSHYDAGQKPVSSTTPCPSFPPLKTFCASCGRIANIPSWRPEILDLALVLHAEHGGGNNSTFTTHVVTSSGTDTYSAIAAALASLKGPKHGGANIKVVQMFEDMKQNLSRIGRDEDAVAAYLRELLHKEAFDQQRA